ncbi:MAG: SpoIIIAH-like family protein [Lachnospiraceae bacterium]|nr:SpoIIIAH-like family protein [Lachnospiraceae bacterium]
MKKVFQKNQVIITALALMIAVAGYVSYTRSNLDGTAAQEASANLTEDSYEISDDTILEGDIFTDTDDSGLEVSASTEMDGMDVAVEDGEVSAGTEMSAEAQVGENPGEAVLTSSTVSSVDFAAEMKLAREQVRAKNKETLLGIVNSTTLTDEQKQAAVDEMIALTDVAEREAAAEMLLEAKGFTDVVVSITEEAVDVVLNMGDVTDAKRAQVEDIVKRKTNISAENIIITPIDASAKDGTSTTESEAGGTQADTQTQAPAGSEAAETTETAEATESGTEM